MLPLVDEYLRDSDVAATRSSHMLLQTALVCKEWKTEIKIERL